LSYAEVSPHKHVLDYKSIGGISIAEMLDGTWTENANSGTWGTSTVCSTGTVGGECYIWIIMSGITAETYNAIDEKIDGSVDSQDGRVRSVVYIGMPPIIYYKYRSKI